MDKAPNRDKIITELIQTSFEYKRLFREHVELEDQINILDKQVQLSTDEQRLRKELQKKKLSGKDLMEKMIARHLTEV